MNWIILLLLGVFLLAPLTGLMSQVNAEILRETWQSPAFAKSLMVTLTSGIAAAFVSVCIGLLFARQFAHNQWFGKRLQRLMLLLPYLIPNFILAIAFVVAWNPITGLLNSFVRFPGGLYGLFGMTFLFSITHMPVAFLLFEEKLKRIDNSLLEAARLSGATARQVFLKIELPLLRPTIIGAFGLCFALDISAFAIPAWIGAPEKVYPLTYKVYQAIQLGGLEGLPQAASFSVVLFLLSLLPLFLGFWLQGNEKKYVLLSGKAAKEGNERQSPLRFLRFQGTFWITQLVFWLAPLTCLFLSTIVKPGCLQSSGLTCLNEISFEHYRYVIFDLAEAKAGLRGSLIYGSFSALFIVIMAIVCLGLFSKKPWQMKTAETLFTIPLATPGAIIALGLIVVYSGKYGINLYNTPWIVVTAFIIKHASLAFQPLRTGLAGISPSLLEAARLSGASPTRVWRRIVLPILRPEYLGGFFLVLIPILGELTMSVFLTSPSFKSIGTVLFDLQDYADHASAGALAILLVVLILTLNELSRLLSNGKLGY
jgi:iron(III) transport system permease protein